MTSPSSSPRVANPRGASARVPGTLFGVVAPFLVAVLVWIVAAPRSELLSVGGGRGLRLDDSGADGGSQLLMLVVLLGAATVCTTLVLWSRHPGLRRPAGVWILALVPGLACALAATDATRLADLLASPADDVPYGEVVRQAPSVGPLFYDRLIYGESGPSWGMFPPGAGWLILGTMVAAFTVAVLAHFSHSPDLVDEPTPVDDVDAQEPGIGDSTTR